jgi:hypothetical protein
MSNALKRERSKHQNISVPESLLHIFYKMRPQFFIIYFLSLSLSVCVPHSPYACRFHYLILYLLCSLSMYSSILLPPFMYTSLSLSLSLSLSETHTNYLVYSLHDSNWVGSGLLLVSIPLPTECFYLMWA